MQGSDRGEQSEMRERGDVHSIINHIISEPTMLRQRDAVHKNKRASGSKSNKEADGACALHL